MSDHLEEHYVTASAPLPRSRNATASDRDGSDTAVVTK